MKQSTFTNVYNKIATEIPFSLDWNNGTGYMDNAVHADLGLKPGEVGKSFTGGENRRRVIIVGTRFGNAVIFDRYTDQDQKEADANIIVVCNFPRELRNLLKDGAYGDDDFYKVVGTEFGSPNIGQVIENLFLDSDDRTTVKTFKEAVKTLLPKKVEGKFENATALDIACEELRFQTSGRVLLTDDCDKEVLYVKNFNPSIGQDVLFVKTYGGKITMLENPVHALANGEKPVRVSAKVFVEKYNAVFDGTFPISVAE